MKERKKIIGLVVLFIFTGIVLYLSLKDNFNEILFQIRNMNIWWIIFAFFLFCVHLFLGAIVTTKIARRFLEKFKLLDAFIMEWEIIFFNAITPFSTGGKPYEIYAIKKSGLKVTDASNVAIQNFIVYQIALVLLGLITLIYNYKFHLFAESHLLAKFVALGFLINTSVVLLLFFVTFSRRTNRKIINFFINILSYIKIIKDKKKSKEKIDSYLKDFHHGAIVLLNNKSKFMELISLHFLSLLALYSIPVIILYGMGDYVSLNGLTTIFASAYVMLIASFVPMPGGAGGIEYVFLVFYGNFIGGSTLNAVMLVWRFITFYFAVVIGAILLSRKRNM